MATHELDINNTLAKRLNLAGKTKEEQEKLIIEALEAQASRAAAAPAATTPDPQIATVLAAMAQQQAAADRRAEQAQERFEAAMTAMTAGRTQPQGPGIVASVGNFTRDVAMEAAHENWRSTPYDTPVGDWARPVTIHAVASGAQIALATAVAVGTVVAVNAATRAYTGKGLLGHMGIGSEAGSMTVAATVTE